MHDETSAGKYVPMEIEKEENSKEWSPRTAIDERGTISDIWMSSS